MKTLAQLAKGEEGYLVGLPKSKDGKRLLQMGLCQGMALRLCQIATGGARIVVAGRRRYAIGAELAKQLTVAKTPPTVQQASLVFTPHRTAQKQPKDTCRIALVGNPNCGKSTLYAAWTKQKRRIGNFPGVTVDTATAAHWQDAGTTVTDLAGLYAIPATRMEEQQSVNWLTQHRPDVMVCVADGRSLAQSLPLVADLTALAIPTVLAVNCADALRKAGIKVDCRALSRALGLPVVLVSAEQEEGLETLLQVAKVAAAAPPPAKITALPNHRSALAAAMQTLCQTAVTRKAPAPHATERADRILCGRWTATLALLLTLFCLLAATFLPSGIGISHLSASAAEAVVTGANYLCASANVPAHLQSFLCDAVLSGLLDVMQFVPMLAFLFFALALLDECGYLARMALAADAPLRRLGLCGSSVVPLMLGFGCTVPGVLAAKTTDSVPMQQKTASLVPYCHCSAKLPLVAFVAAAYAWHTALTFAALYLLGIGVACILARAGKQIDTPPFCIELPNYRTPNFARAWRSTVDRTRDFVKKVWWVSLLLSATIWSLTAFAPNTFATLGAWLALPLAPLGLGDARLALALTVGFLSKESTLACVAVLFANADVASVLSPQQAVAFLTFYALYPPCIHALHALCDTLGKHKTAVHFVTQMAVAYGVTGAVALALRVGAWTWIPIALATLLWARCRPCQHHCRQDCANCQSP